MRLYLFDRFNKATIKSKSLNMNILKGQPIGIGWKANAV